MPVFVRKLFSASPHPWRGATMGQHLNHKSKHQGMMVASPAPQPQGFGESVLVSAGNLSEERRGFRAEASLLPQCNKEVKWGFLYMCVT